MDKLEQSIQDQEAATAALAQTFSTDLAEIAADLKTLADEVTSGRVVGTVISDAQIARINANSENLKAMSAALDAAKASADKAVSDANPPVSTPAAAGSPVTA